MAVSGEISVNATLTGNLTISEKVKIESNKNVAPSNVEQVVVPSENYDALAQVTVGAVSLQNKTVTPSASQQQITPDSGYIGLKKVTVNAAAELLDTMIYNETYGQVFNYNIASDSSYQLYGFKNSKLNVTTPENVTMIKSNAFAGLNLIKNFVGTNVNNVEENAFLNCKQMQSVTLPRATTNGKFYSGAFKGCDSLTDVYLGGFFEIYSPTYDQFNNSCTIHVPSELLSQYQNNAEWTAFIAAQAQNYVTITLAGDYVVA